MYVLQDVQCLSGLRIVVFYVTNVFAVPKCQVLPVCPMYALLHVSHVSLYMPLLSWSCVVSWFFGFGQLLQCVCVSLFEEVGYLSDFGTVISESSPFIVVAVVGCVHLGFTLYLCSQFGYVMNGEFIVVCYVSYFLPFCYSPFS